MAHKFAFESPQIWADAVSSVQLPELAGEYGVLGTPHTVIAHRQQGAPDEPGHLLGPVSQAQLLAAVIEVQPDQ